MLERKELIAEFPGQLDGISMTDCFGRLYVSAWCPVARLQVAHDRVADLVFIERKHGKPKRVLNS
jgi:hypothetical protein